MKKIVFLVVAPFVFFALAILGLVILFSTVGGTAQAAACALSAVQSPAKVGSASTTLTTSLAPNPNCGASAPLTLPTFPVVNDGLPHNYVVPASATASETVAITYALAQLSKPYLWGGSGPAAFDCSGLTMMARTQAVVTLLHYTGNQVNEGSAVASYAGISPGDLVLVLGGDGTIANPGHVGIYLGDALCRSARCYANSGNSGWSSSPDPWGWISANFGNQRLSSNLRLFNQEGRRHTRIWLLGVEKVPCGVSEGHPQAPRPRQNDDSWP